MSTNRARVGLARSDNRRHNVFQALEAVRADVVPKLRDQVMLKPNFLSSKNQLASSHVDAMRGAIDFLLTVDNPPDEIVVAEGGNEDYSGQAFEHFHYHDLLDEYDVPIRLVDLNQEVYWVETPIILADQSETTVRMPKTVLDCPCTISMAVAKTHDVCVVTLALKNMIMGTLHKKDRVHMHGFPSHAERRLPDEAQVLNINLMRLARYLRPDIAVIDGTRGLEGNGPGGNEEIDLGIAVASADVFAADAVMAKVMGFDPAKLGLLHYAKELGMGAASFDAIEIVGPGLAGLVKPFKPHETTHLQLQWQHADAPQYLPA